MVKLNTPRRGPGGMHSIRHLYGFCLATLAYDYGIDLGGRYYPAKIQIMFRAGFGQSRLVMSDLARLGHPAHGLNPSVSTD